MQIPAVLEDGAVPLSAVVRQAVWLLLHEVRDVETRLAKIDAQLAQVLGLDADLTNRLALAASGSNPTDQIES